LSKYISFAKNVIQLCGYRRFPSIALKELTKKEKKSISQLKKEFFNFKSNLTESEIKAIVNETNWWHSFKFENITNRSTNVPPSQQMWVADAIPQDLTGKTVLDLGGADGFYSFLCEQRGAKKVVCADFMVFDGFKAAKKIINSHVEHRIINLPNMESLENFDIVLFFGLYYHLPNPVEILQKLYDKVNESIILAGPIIDCEEPMMYYYDPFELHSEDDSNWWVASSSCLLKIAKRIGFKQVSLLNEKILGNPDSILRNKKTKRFVYKFGLFQFSKSS